MYKDIITGRVTSRPILISEDLIFDSYSLFVLIFRDGIELNPFTQAKWSKEILKQVQLQNSLQVTFVFGPDEIVLLLPQDVEFGELIIMFLQHVKIHFGMFYRFDFYIGDASLYTKPLTNCYGLREKIVVTTSSCRSWKSYFQSMNRYILYRPTYTHLLPRTLSPDLKWTRRV